MARAAVALCALAAYLQLVSCLSADTSAGHIGGGSRDASLLRIGFSCTGLSADNARSADFGPLIAKASGVPLAAVNQIAVGDPDGGVVQVSADIQAVNLAAPYARLSSGGAPGVFAAALQSIGAAYSPHSLQVSAPAWVAEATQAARDPGHEGKLRFVMSGVALPDLDQTRLRAVLGSVTGVRLGDVRVLGVEYAVAARVLGRRGGDGYRTLRVTAAVTASAAAAGSLRLAAEERPSLAKALRSELGASFCKGSLEVTFPPGALSGTPRSFRPPFSSSSSSGGAGIDWQQHLVTFASAAAGAATFAAVFCCVSAMVNCCRSTAAAASTASSAHSSAAAAQWANPAYQQLPAVGSST